MALRFKVGQLVICVRTNDPGYEPLLLNAVGEVTEVEPFADSPVAQLLSVSADYIVHFPGTAGALCPCCNKEHGTKWLMQDNELAPFEDPDKGAEDEKSSEPEMGFNA